MTKPFRLIPSSPFDVEKALRHHPDVGSWPDLARAMDLPARWVESEWASRAFAHVRYHGSALAKTVAFPDAHALADLFESVRLEEYGSNRTPDGYGAPYPNGGGCFLRGRGARDLAPFFKPRASRYIKTRKNGEFFCHGINGDTSTLLTVVKLRDEFRARVFGDDPDRAEQRFSFEAIRHDNGKLLVTAHDGLYLSRPWLAYLDAGESPFDMLSDSEKTLYRDSAARDEEAYACIAPDGKTVDVAAAAAAGIPIIADKY